MKLEMAGSTGCVVDRLHARDTRAPQGPRWQGQDSSDEELLGVAAAGYPGPARLVRPLRTGDVGNEEGSFREDREDRRDDASAICLLEERAGPEWRRASVSWSDQGAEGVCQGEPAGPVISPVRSSCVGLPA